MSKHPEIVFHLAPNLLEFFFLFSLNVLEGKEPLPKGASAEFWANFISLKPVSSAAFPTLEQSFHSALTHLGPLLARSLVYNVGGHAARSELDRLCEPLKKLVTLRPEAAGWLETALADEGLFSQQSGGREGGVGRDEKVVFLRRVVG